MKAIKTNNQTNSSKFAAAILLMAISAVSAFAGGLDVESVSISPENNRVVAGSKSKITGYVHMTSAAEKTVKVQLWSPGEAVKVPESIVIRKGEADAKFEFTAESPVNVETSAAIYASFNNKVATEFLLVPMVKGIKFERPGLPGGSSMTGVIEFEQPADREMKFELKLDSKFAKTDEIVRAKPGSTRSEEFTIWTSPVSESKVVNLTVEGEVGKAQEPFNLNAAVVSKAFFDEKKVAGGEAVKCTLTLTGSVAESKDVYIKWSAEVGKSPEVIHIEKGQSSASFEVNTFEVNVTTSALMYVIDGSRNLALRLTAVPLFTAALESKSVSGGDCAVVKVTLSQTIKNDAKFEVTVKGDDVSGPGSFSIPAGETSGSFKVETKSGKKNRTAVITITSGGLTKTLKLSIKI